jgi:dihydrofolate reductase
MTKPLLSIIAAIGENRAIGLGGKMPWNIREDLRRFRQLTQGHVIIMGRRTFESLGKKLDGRINIIITTDDDFRPYDCIVAGSVDEALEKARELEKEEIFICGGGSVYAQTIDLADKLYLTVVKGNFEADTFFPEYPQFTKIVSKKESRDENFEYTFLELEKE